MAMWVQVFLLLLALSGSLVYKGLWYDSYLSACQNAGKIMLYALL